MTLNLKLVIEGDASAATKATKDTSAEIVKLDETVTKASTNIGSIGTGAETAMGKVSDASGEAAGNIGNIKTSTTNASGAFRKLGRVATGVLSGIAGGVIAGGMVLIFDTLIGKVKDFADDVLSATGDVERAAGKVDDLVKRIKGGLRLAKSGIDDFGADSAISQKYDALRAKTEARKAFLRAQGQVVLPGRLPGKRETPGGGEFGIGQLINPYEDRDAFAPFRASIEKLRESMKEGKGDFAAFRDEINAIAVAGRDDAGLQSISAGLVDDKDIKLAIEAQAAYGEVTAAVRAFDGDAEAAASVVGTKLAPEMIALTGAARGTIPELAEVNRLLKSIATNGGAASGDVTGGPAQPFAAGGIVTGPTFFRFGGNKLGVMGEAGPEAIMPLASGPGGPGVMAVGGGGEQSVLAMTRMSSGKLGVKMPTGFAAGGIIGGVNDNNITRFASGGVIDDLKSLSSGFLSGFISDLRQAKSVTDALRGSVMRLADQLLNRAFQQGIDALVGAVFGSILPNAKGNIFTKPAMFGFGAGKLGVLGEAGPEAIMPLTMAASGFAVGAVANDNRETSLPVTRLSGGRLGVAMPTPFARGDVFGSSPSAPISSIVPEAGMKTGTTNNFYITTPNPRAFAEDRSLVYRGADRLARQARRFT